MQHPAFNRAVVVAKKVGANPTGGTNLQKLKSRPAFDRSAQ
jgi:hypothetical protein